MAAGMILYNLRLALFCFIAFVPLMSGLQSLGILKNTCLLSFSFSSMYIAWFPKIVICKKSTLRAKSAVSVCIDLLTTIVLLSLANHLLLYQSSIAVSALLYIPVITQIHDMQAITASFVFLQGCFLFRLLEIEDDTFRALQSRIIPIFCIQAFTILFFSALQLAFNVPSSIAVPLTAAFQDSHALATYSVFLIFFFLNYSFLQNYFLKAAMLSLTLFFLILAILACGRSEWAAALLILLVMLYNKISPRKYVSLISLVFIIVLLINIFPQFLASSRNPYFNRLKSLLLVSQYFSPDNGSTAIRFLLWKRAVNSIMHAPITGNGIGAIYKPSPDYMVKDPAFPMSQYPHNYFLHIAAEIGIPGLLIFLLIVFYAFKNGFIEVKAKTRGSPFIKVCLSGLSLYVITFIIGHHLILPVHQFLFWFIMAGLVLRLPTQGSPAFCLSGALRKGIILFFTLLILNYAFNFIKGDRSSKIYGYYGLERSVEGKPFFWTKKESSDQMTAQSDMLMITVTASKYNIGDDGLFIKLFINDTQVLEQHFLSPQTKVFYCYVPGIAHKEIIIKTWVDKTFCPKSIGLNNDSRELGIMMSPVAFWVDILPKDGIGFYNWETWGAPLSSDWSDNVPVRVRWTGLRASMDIGNYTDRSFSFFLHAAHPDIQQFPVTVKITGDNKIIIQELFNSTAWKKVLITPEELKGSTRITFEVSRTWNPKLSGVSNDTRDLGIAVAIPEQWRADLERTMLADLNHGSLHNQQDRSLLLNIIPNIQMAMDFSRIIKKEDVLYALSGLTGQKAIIQGATILVDGPKKGSHALMISDKDDYAYTRVHFSPLEINTQEGSLSIWARLEAPLKKDSCLIAVLSQNVNNIIRIDHNGSDGGFTVYYNDSEVGKSNISIKDTNWHHYVFTWEKGEQRFYIDSEEVLSCAKEASHDMATRLCIGGLRRRSLNQWHGAVASFFTFNCTLTKAEIGFLYRNR